MIFSQSEYDDRKIMAVKRLPKSSSGIMFGEFYDIFFDKFKFKEMKRNKGVKGENDVDALILGGTGVACIDCNDIREVADMFQNSKDDFGYYEVDNRSKYSIC